MRSLSINIVSAPLRQGFDNDGQLSACIKNTLTIPYQKEGRGCCSRTAVSHSINSHPWVWHGNRKTTFRPPTARYIMTWLIFMSFQSNWQSVDQCWTLSPRYLLERMSSSHFLGYFLVCRSINSCRNLESGQGTYENQTYLINSASAHPVNHISSSR